MSSAAERRQRILQRIAKAAAVARRDPAGIQLIAVSKGRSAEEIEALIEAGQRDFGENRVQEALAKWSDLKAGDPDIRLHGIGRLQSNKAAEAVGLFDVIHSLDRASLLDALVREAGKAGRYGHQADSRRKGQMGDIAFAGFPQMLLRTMDHRVSPSTRRRGLRTGVNSSR